MFVNSASKHTKSATKTETNEQICTQVDDQHRVNKSYTCVYETQYLFFHVVLLVFVYVVHSMNFIHKSVFTKHCL